MSTIELAGVTKAWGGTVAVDDVSFTVEEGSFVVLLWPLVITNSVETRPLTVGLAIFGAPESGVDWSIITAGTLLAVAPLLIAFLLFQRQFVQSFMHAGIK